MQNYCCNSNASLYGVRVAACMVFFWELHAHNGWNPFEFRKLWRIKCNGTYNLPLQSTRHLATRQGVSLTSKPTIFHSIQRSRSHLTNTLWKVQCSLFVQMSGKCSTSFSIYLPSLSIVIVKRIRNIFEDIDKDDIYLSKIFHKKITIYSN